MGSLPVRAPARKLVADMNPEEFLQMTDASPVDTALLERFEKVTGRKPHRYLRRGIVFCHHDLEVILDKHERGERFYLFSGRGPSSDSLHLGHAIPFEFTQWLQDVFRVPLILILTDDMKLLHSKKLTAESVKEYGIKNAKDVLAFGYRPESTFLFSNLEFVGGAFYENIIKVARHIGVDDMKGNLGFTDSDNVGMFYCCSTQSAATFATSFPGILGMDAEELKSVGSLVMCSYDIDGYFCEVRRHAEDIGAVRPAFLNSCLLPALQGAELKMSASVASSAIYLSDSPAVVQEKLQANQGSFDRNAIIRYLTFFVEDDEDLNNIRRRSAWNIIGIPELTQILAEVIQMQLASFQVRRAQVTDETLQAYKTRRLLFW